MTRPLFAATVLLCAAAAHAADAPDATPAQTAAALQALAARVQALEADSAKLRQTAAQALAQADQARAELIAVKAQLVAAQQAAPSAPAAAPALAAPPADSVAARVAAVSAAPPAQDTNAKVAAVSAPAPSATAAQVAAVSAPADGGGGNAGGANGNAFNPAIAVILNGLYEHHSLAPERYVRAGFPLVDGFGTGPQGFSLGESEVSFAANIDDKFYGQFTVSYDDDNGHVGTNIEEAYIDTIALPDGFSLRAGRFYSNIGYLNSHHTHTDNFVDRPLAYQAFLGDQYGDDGVQVRWVAPLDYFLEFGGEVFRGENFPTAGEQHSGSGAHTLFAHAGGDVGTENSWLAGVSMLQARSAGADDGFTGTEHLYLADATWKWAPHGNTKDGGLTLRSEYFLDRRNGFLSAVVNAIPADSAIDLTEPALDAPWTGERRGGYLEAVYRLNRTWDFGYRFDKLWATAGDPYATGFDPLRHSVELTWRNSEFSFFRLQLSRDEPYRGLTDNVLSLQYDVSLGAHGAHKF